MNKMGHGVYTTEKNMANGIYFSKILDISYKLGKDRDKNKISFEQWNQLHNKINDFWRELCRIDQENGIDIE